MLAETQARFRRALGDADASAVLPLVSGVADAARRMEIYRRHHRESLVRHILGRFPTVEWLLGSASMSRLAAVFIAAHPPAAPCMAEYGADFPELLDVSEAARRHRYLRAAAELDWLLGEVAVAIDAPPLSIATLAGHPAERLPDLKLRLQPGTRYLECDWAVDDLVRLRLGGDAPDRYVLDATPVFLEIAGARGTFGIGRLDRAVFAFRAGLAGGDTIGAAVEAAFGVDSAVDAGAALASLFADRLVMSVVAPD